jgi:short/branched chain acyl-CoA dehydrogenase
MGIEAPAKYNGANSTFFTSILAIEELSKVDGSVSLMCDLQNTLMIPLILQHGSEYLKDTYLPKLTTSMVILTAYVF